MNKIIRQKFWLSTAKDEYSSHLLPLEEEKYIKEVKTVRNIKESLIIE